MSKNLKSTIKLIMKPVIRLLLNSGVTYREFADTCKSLYVEVAAEGFGLKDRPTNTSRIAVLTGLDRKQIKAIRDQLESDAPDSNHSVDRVSRLLSGWHQDADFADAFGNPLALEEKVTPYVTTYSIPAKPIRNASKGVPLTSISPRIKSRNSKLI